MEKLIKNNLVIELHVPDFEVAKDFYSKLGFKVSLEDKPIEKEPGYMTMIRSDILGNTLLNFYGGDDRVYNQSFFKQFPRDTKRGFEIEITIPVENIEQLYKRAMSDLREYVVREIKELEDRNYTWKDFRMTDPFGFYIRLTELIDWGQK